MEPNVSTESALTVMGDAGEFLLEISVSGDINFNTEKYPNLTAGEFASKFIEVLSTAKVFDGMNVAQITAELRALRDHVELQNEALFGLRAKLADATKKS